MLQNQKAFQLAANYLMQGRHRSRGYKYVIDVAGRGKLAREHTDPSLAVRTYFRPPPFVGAPLRMGCGLGERKPGTNEYRHDERCICHVEPGIYCPSTRTG